VRILRNLVSSDEWPLETRGKRVASEKAGKLEGPILPRVVLEKRLQRIEREGFTFFVRAKEAASD
jgi:hypothetical protein